MTDLHAALLFVLAGLVTGAGIGASLAWVSANETWKARAKKAHLDGVALGRIEEAARRFEGTQR